MNSKTVATDEIKVPDDVRKAAPQQSPHDQKRLARQVKEQGALEVPLRVGAKEDDKYPLIEAGDYPYYRAAADARLRTVPIEVIGARAAVVESSVQEPKDTEREPVRRAPGVDPEFEALIPALTPEENTLLERSVCREGCREPLVAWRDEDILLDGHNRLRVCRQHGMSFRVHYVDLPDRRAARNWIINNQLGRRNLTPEQASYLRGKRYLLEKAQGERKDLTSGKSCQKLTAAGRIAEDLKISERTVRNDAQFARAVDTLSQSCGSGTHQEILSRTSRAAKKDILDLAEKPAKVQKRSLEALRTGKAKRLGEAVRIAEKGQAGKNPPGLPQRRYTVIYAAPDWGAPGARPQPAADVATLAEDQAVLYLGVPPEKLQESFRMIRSWGFQYRTALACDQREGNSSHLELLLVATRGDELPGGLENVAPVVHVESPEALMEVVEGLHPEGARLDLFGQEHHAGWDTVTDGTRLSSTSSAAGVGPRERSHSRQSIRGSSDHENK